ncbi:MAG: prepilin-type N-terminal cleavage/methylation domain-containing protein [Rubrivivax sp.]|nr:MAG: prepilin-type N-terminal cleavage/methylation domain-containing protein [Rubrivivax sp.]
MTPIRRGFTLLEMLTVIAIIAILALIAMPSYQGKAIREQIAEGVTLAAIAKTPIAASWGATKVLPADNAAAGLPNADKIVNNMVTSVAVQDGVINITFGNQANGGIKGKVLSLRPAVIEDAQIVPVTWVCGHAAAPDKMTIKGVDKTDIPPTFLPYNCRAKATP